MISIVTSTPTPSLIVSCLMSLAMLITSDVYVLINYFSFTLWLWTGIATVALIHMRVHQTRLEPSNQISVDLSHFILIFMSDPNTVRYICGTVRRILWIRSNVYWDSCFFSYKDVYSEKIQVRPLRNLC